MYRPHPLIPANHPQEPRRIRPHKLRPHPPPTPQHVPPHLPPPNQANIHNPGRRPRNIADTEYLSRIRMQRIGVQANPTAWRSSAGEPIDFGEVFGEIGASEAAAPGLGVVLVREAGGVDEGVNEFLAVVEDGELAAGGRREAVESGREGEDGADEEEEEDVYIEWGEHACFVRDSGNGAQPKGYNS